MDPSIVNQPGWPQIEFPQFDFPYAAEIHNIAQQPYNPYDDGLALNSALQAQPQSEQFMFGQDPILHSFDPSPALHSHEHNGVEPTSGVQTTPATSMPPPSQKRKRKVPTLRANDWEPYKARIVELHIAQRLPLPEVKQKIEGEFGFTAEYVMPFDVEQTRLLVN